MRWRRFPVWIGCLVVFAAAGLFWVFRPVPRRNILLITLDTTRADRLGCYGHVRAETPQLDQLAQQGVLFERAYATAPMTAPSHASMFTGLFPPEHGVYTNGLVALEPDVPVLADKLRRQGYATAAFVASMVVQARSGLNRGFELYDDDLSTAEPTDDDLHRNRDGSQVIDAATKWLKKRTQQPSPFFCWVHLFDPHEPYLAHEQEFGDRFQDSPYDGEIAYVDRQLGRLFQALNKLGLREQTVIVVVGDHGESLGEHNEQMHGYQLHDSTLRVPLIIADPRLGGTGRRVSTPVSLVDLFPTLLEIAKTPVPAEMAGRNLAPALRGKPLPPRICYSQTMEPYIEAGWSPLQSLTTDRWRYVRTTRPELYDLTADPAELKNLADQEPDRVSELDGELAAFEATLKRRTGSAVKLSDRERRSLESLGYAGGAAADNFASDDDQPRPDIKDMIGHLNDLFRAQDLLEHEKCAEAIAVLQPLAERVPNFLRARSTLGQCLVKEEKYEEAIPWFESALELDPNYERAQILSGFSYLKLRQFPQAEAQLQQALERNPDSENAHLFLGEVAQRQENFPLALRHYERVLQINPRNRAAHDVYHALRAALATPP